MHQLVRKYAGLRVARPGAEQRLVASLATVGQMTPVLVVAAEEASGGAYVLIDGYRRVAALERIGRDTVNAMVVSLSERDALLWHHQHAAERARTALEEAWLIRELIDSHGLSQAELSRQLGRTESWVSRRLALLAVLSESVQRLVRQGKLCAYAAEKYLVPLARAKPSDCERLAHAVAGAGMSTRAMKRLYVAWKQGTAEQRQRIVANPLLFLAAEAEVHARSHEPAGHRVVAPPQSLDDELALAIDELARISQKLCEQLAARKPAVALPASVQRAWRRAHPSLSTLQHELESRWNARQ